MTFYSAPRQKSRRKNPAERRKKDLLDLHYFIILIFHCLFQHIIPSIFIVFSMVLLQLNSSLEHDHVLRSHTVSYHNGNRSCKSQGSTSREQDIPRERSEKHSFWMLVRSKWSACARTFAPGVTSIRIFEVKRSGACDVTCCPGTNL